MCINLNFAGSLFNCQAPSLVFSKIFPISRYEPSPEVQISFDQGCISSSFMAERIEVISEKNG